MGGDLEHTHLVKGLDYALLQKVKAELEKKELELDEEEHQANLNEKRDNEENAENSKLTDEDEENDETDLSKLNLKPKIATKSTTAAIAAVLTKSLQDNSSSLKK